MERNFFLLKAKKRKKKIFEEEKEKEEIIMEKGIFLRLDGHCPLGKGIEGSKRGPRRHKKDQTKLSLLGVAFRLVCLDRVYHFRQGLK